MKAQTIKDTQNALIAALDAGVEVPTPSTDRMAELLAIINKRPEYNIEEFVDHCRNFYKPN